MEIRKREWKKIMLHPALWCLLAVFFLFNCFGIWARLEGGTKRELQEIHRIILDTGIDLSGNQEKRARLAGSGDQLEADYAMAAEAARELYKTLDMIEIKKQKQQIFQYNPTGSFGRFIDHNYEKLQERLEEIKADGEGEGAFYPGEIYQVHSFLYCSLVKPLILEMVVLVALSVLFLMDYERIQKTEDIVLVSKTGRRLIWIKAQVGLLAGMTMALVLMALSMGVFFWQVRFDGLWDVPVCSAMLAELRGFFFYPFITFWKISVGGYLALAVAVALGLVLLSGIVTAAVQMFLKNSYFTFVLEGLLFFGLLALSFQKTITWLDLVIDLNPVCLWYLCGAWFMENSLWMSFPGTEFASLGVTGIVAGVLLCLGWKRYLGRDIR